MTKRIDHALVNRQEQARKAQRDRDRDKRLDARTDRWLRRHDGELAEAFGKKVRTTFDDTRRFDTWIERRRDQRGSTRNPSN